MEKSISELTMLWQKTLNKVEEKINDKQMFDAFFENSYICEAKNNTLIIAVGTSLAVNLLSNKYFEIISQAVADSCEENYKLEFVVESDYIKNAVSVNTVRPEKHNNYFKDSKLNESLTFDNFVVGSFNKEASQAALVCASNPGQIFNPLFIYGNSGLGKTHLLHAIGNYVATISKPGSKVLCISANDFVEEYVKYVKGEKDAETIKDYVCSFDALLIDDIQFMANKVKTQEEFFTIFNKIKDAGKLIVITSDRQPSELKGIEERLVTRFSQGLSMKINEPDESTCVEILKKKIFSSNLDPEIFDEGVLIFFAEKFSSNVRELEGAFNRLTFYCLQLKQAKKITMELAIEAVGNLLGAKGAVNELNEQKIINIVADYYNLSPNQLTGKIRTGQIALARHIAMYLIRNNIDVPLKKIGSMFGGKDHTTVINAISKVDSMLKTDENLQKAIEELTKRIKP